MLARQIRASRSAAARGLPIRDPNQFDHRSQRIAAMRALAITLIISAGFAVGQRALPTALPDLSWNGPSQADAETHTAHKPIQNVAAPVPSESPTVETQAAAPAQAAPKTAFHSMLDDLHECVRRLEAIPGYTCVLEQQVLVHGALREPETIHLKLRRSPFSVYMKWDGDGQEVLYAEGQNSGKLLARPTRGLVALRGVWRLPPTSAQAMKQSRYPVTELGIEKLAVMALDFHQARNNSTEGLTCTATHGLADGRPATIYTVVFASDEAAPEYARSILTFDRESGLLVALENRHWGPDGREGGLLEKYVYHEFHPAPDLTDEDFSPANPAYGFKK
jgi:hypothetical protein